MVIDLVQNGFRTDTSIVIIVALTYVILGIPFMFGRRWARRTMGALVVIAALAMLDVMMASHGEMSQPGIFARVVAAIAGYTLLFLAISAEWHSQRLP